MELIEMDFLKNPNKPESALLYLDSKYELFTLIGLESGYEYFGTITKERALKVSLEALKFGEITGLEIDFSEKAEIQALILGSNKLAIAKRRELESAEIDANIENHPEWFGLPVKTELSASEYFFGKKGN